MSRDDAMFACVVVMVVGILAAAGRLSGEAVERLLLSVASYGLGRATRKDGLDKVEPGR